MAPDLPPEAVEAARQATGRCLGLTHSPAELISLALVAAAPHIAAAERERLRNSQRAHLARLRLASYVESGNPLDAGGLASSLRAVLEAINGN